MSDGVLLASVIIFSDFLGGFSIEWLVSNDFVSRDLRWAATLPNIPLVRSDVIKLLEFVESLRESFEPKLSFRYGEDVFIDVLVALIIVFVPIGGRSLTGDA